MIRRQAAARYLGSRCGCCWNSIDHQIFLFFSHSYVSRSECVPVLHSFHCKVWQLSCSCSLSAIQAETQHFTVAEAQGHSIFCQLCCGGGRWTEEKSCSYSSSLLLQELLELFCHPLQATDRIFNQKTLLIRYA